MLREVVCGGALRGSWRRGVGDSEGVASHVATGIRPGRIPPWSESTSGLLERSVGGWSLVTSEFAKRCELLTGCAGLGRGDPSQKEVRQWTAKV